LHVELLFLWVGTIVFEVTDFSTVEATILLSGCVDVHCFAVTSEGDTSTSVFVLMRRSRLVYWWVWLLTVC